VGNSSAGVLAVPLQQTDAFCPRCCLCVRVCQTNQKNEKTMQAQALAAIQRYNCILLSGTPTQNVSDSTTSMRVLLVTS